MPFTPSHIAAVVPLISSPRIRRWLDPWALAVGAMIPDLPIFLPFLPEYGHWHSLYGVLTIDVVAVILVLGLFQEVFREPLISLLPPALAGRAATLRPGFRPLPVVFGAMVGAFTHVFWDSFTHTYSLEIWGWTWLDHEVFGVIRVFRLLQYGSSVVGLAIVAWWAWRALNRMETAATPERLVLSRRARWTVLGSSAAGMVAGAFVWPMIDEPTPWLGLPSVLTKVGAGTLVGLMFVLVGYVALWHWQTARRA
ncbi:DUF4184 family protein [Nonomuraea sp. NPDC050663]|uniref:DUF4184 family protein n=1 Tax=Nonomuraea sp. NPDC050663 TaxID=3364370 RepID=UPI0037A70EEC